MKKPLALFAALAAACSLGTAALAAPPVMLNDALITQIPKSDQAAFRQAVADALNTSPDGLSTSWSSTPRRKGAPPITVKLTPTQTSKGSNDRLCRFLQGDFSRTSTSETWKFWFCKQPDGTWKASST
ncbi:hypothetical protein [Achromobacter sp. Marseille-Q4962]|uniref:hypothetical protein n=1 Tax=Achromobacter sp. Marseille-Q4962 TaxID=2942202 RepID=UPI0020732D62|nr:hypothetical protein [Achromobacter sp. Marseille-Q4962]